MKQYFYPAVFHTAEEGGFWVSFPDFPECLTQGDSMEEAYEMANEALGLTITDRLTDHEALPVPSLPDRSNWMMRIPVWLCYVLTWKHIGKNIIQRLSKKLCRFRNG